MTTMLKLDREYTALLWIVVASPQAMDYRLFAYTDQSDALAEIADLWQQSMKNKGGH